MGLPGVALAGPREDAQNAYAVAVHQFHELELDSAAMTIEMALKRARGAGFDSDPTLAPLLVLRGALIYSQTADLSRTMTNFEQAIQADHHVELPIELRSKELETLLEQARTRIVRPLAPPPPPAPLDRVTSVSPPSHEAEEVVDEPDDRVHSRRGSASRWPRFYIDLGVGTGVGIPRGVAEHSYQQYVPGDSYGPAEQACAIARWYAGDGELASSPGQFAENLDPTQIPSGATDVLKDAYDPSQCAKLHSVTPGIASAPLHLAPEVMVRVHERDIGRGRSLSLLIGAFGRLQLVTGSMVFTEDPSQARELSFYNQVRSSKPAGTRRKPGFTWATGAKLEALIAKRDGKLHWMFGLFGGYGHSRLRVDLGFSNDRNGNSVPDELEAAFSVSDDEDDEGDEGSVARCTPVWPYNSACTPGSSGEFDVGIAEAVRASVPDGDRRIDTVRLGPLFAGVLLGLRYQPHEHFGLYGEIDVGGWFPGPVSPLIDINVGPSITF
jgi:hypothetical protein